MTRDKETKIENHTDNQTFGHAPDINFFILYSFILDAFLCLHLLSFISKKTSDVTPMILRDNEQTHCL